MKTLIVLLFLFEPLFAQREIPEKIKLVDLEQSSWLKPENLRRQEEIRQSAQRIKIYLNGKLLSDSDLPGRLISSACLDQALWKLTHDKNEIRGGGMIMNGGHIVGSGHRFMSPMDEKISALEIRITNKKASPKIDKKDQFKVLVEALHIPEGRERIFQSEYSSSSCISYEFDLLQWLELAGSSARPKQSPQLKGAPPPNNDR